MIDSACAPRCCLRLSTSPCFLVPRLSPARGRGTFLDSPKSHCCRTTFIYVVLDTRPSAFSAACTRVSAFPSASSASARSRRAKARRSRTAARWHLELQYRVALDDGPRLGAVQRLQTIADDPDAPSTTPGGALRAARTPLASSLIYWRAPRGQASPASSRSLGRRSAGRAADPRIGRCPLLRTRDGRRSRGTRR